MNYFVKFITLTKLQYYNLLCGCIIQKIGLEINTKEYATIAHEQKK